MRFYKVFPKVFALLFLKICFCFHVVFMISCCFFFVLFVFLFFFRICFFF